MASSLFASEPPKEPHAPARPEFSEEHPCWRPLSPDGASVLELGCASAEIQDVRFLCDAGTRSTTMVVPIGHGASLAFRSRLVTLTDGDRVLLIDRGEFRQSADKEEAPLGTKTLTPGEVSEMLFGKDDPVDPTQEPVLWGAVLTAKNAAKNYDVTKAVRDFREKFPGRRLGRTDDKMISKRLDVLKWWAEKLVDAYGETGAVPELGAIVFPCDDPLKGRSELERIFMTRPRLTEISSDEGVPVWPSTVGEYAGFEDGDKASEEPLAGLAAVSGTMEAFEEIAKSGYAGATSIEATSIGTGAWPSWAVTTASGTSGIELPYHGEMASAAVSAKTSAADDELPALSPWICVMASFCEAEDDGVVDERLRAYVGHAGVPGFLAFRLVSRDDGRHIELLPPVPPGRIPEEGACRSIQELLRLPESYGTELLITILDHVRDAFVACREPYAMEAPCRPALVRALEEIQAWSRGIRRSRLMVPEDFEDAADAKESDGAAPREAITLVVKDDTGIRKPYLSNGTAVSTTADGATQWLSGEEFVEVVNPDDGTALMLSSTRLCWPDDWAGEAAASSEGALAPEATTISFSAVVA